MKADGRPEIPKTLSSRPNGITIDAAEMNPTRTGWEMKFTTPPRLKTPKNKIMQPVSVLIKSISDNFGCNCPIVTRINRF